MIILEEEEKCECFFFALRIFKNILRIYDNQLGEEINKQKNKTYNILEADLIKDNEILPRKITGKRNTKNSCVFTKEFELCGW